tara:strand:- start:259 stop:660 length:402 start_codon:yes stop_codon:yes gene_type:complete
MKSKKNIKFGRVKFLVIFLALFFNPNVTYSDNLTLEGNFLEIKVLDKVSSKNYKLNIKIGEQKIFKNISIKPFKCKNSEFDDNPEITAYLQVKDLKNKDKNEVFVFNGWTFSSSPALRPFDHPVYDIWLTKCF